VRSVNEVEKFPLISASQYRHHPLVDFELNEIKASLEFERSVNENVGYRTLFSTPGNRKRVRIMMALAIFSQVGLHT